MRLRSGRLTNIANILPVNGDRTALDVTQPQEQCHQCRLAGARQADDADLFTRRDLQVEVGQHGLSVDVVGEIHMIEPDATLAGSPILRRPAGR